MNNNIINIYGKGGHAKVLNSILINKNFKNIFFWNDKDFNDNIKGPWIIAIGNNKDRRKISKILKNKLFLNLIEKSALINNKSIGIGSQILHRAVIQIGTIVGNHCIVNTCASIDHDCILNDFCFIGPNSTLCGNVTIGEETFIGAGVTILPNIKIGKNCLIGAGSVVTKNIPDNSIAYGNPAKIK